jgi:hypothetical protein
MSLKVVANSLQDIISPFVENEVDEKLSFRLEDQSKNLFCCDYSTLPNHILHRVIPAMSDNLDRLIKQLLIDEALDPGKPILSVHNLRVVYSAIELIWQWGIQPTVASSSGFTLPESAYPSSLLVHKRTVDHVFDYIKSHVIQVEHLEKLITSVMRLVSNDSFSGLMLQRNLDRILLVFIMLSDEDKVSVLDKSGVESNSFIKLRAVAVLRSLYEGPFASMVVSKLRAFTRGPTWLREASCAILTNVLQGERGVEIVLSGYLEGKFNIIVYFTTLYTPDT